MTIDPTFTIIGTVVTQTDVTGVAGAASNVARTKIKDTHDEYMRAFPTLKLQQETSMAETSYTSSEIIIYYLFSNILDLWKFILFNACTSSLDFYISKKGSCQAEENNNCQCIINYYRIYLLSIYIK